MPFHIRDEGVISTSMLDSLARYKQTLVLLLCYGAYSVIAYQHATNYFYLFDDFALIGLAQNNDCISLLTLPLIGFFRPLVFIFLKVQYAVFGWESPSGYCIVSLVVHAINSLLVRHLVLLLKPKESWIATLSGILYLFSPWSSETFFWASLQFDVFGGFFTLLSLHAGLRAFTSQNKIAIGCYTTSAALCYFLALVCKEAFVPVPVLLFVLHFIQRPGAMRSLNISHFAYGLFSTCALVLYLIIRGNHLAFGDGAYGNFFALARRAQPQSLFFGLALWPFNRVNTLSYWVQKSAVISSGIIAIAFCMKRPYRREMGLLMLAIAITFVPVYFFKRGFNSTNSGRALQFAGIFWSIILSMGLYAAASINFTVRKKKIIMAFMYGLICCLAVSSVLYQAKIWRSATRISRLCVQQFAKVRAPHKVYFVKNLPSTFIEGPYILKPYAFMFFFQDSSISVISRDVSLSWNGGNILKLRTKEPNKFDKQPNDIDTIAFIY
jgi:hypothetical protein